MTNTEPTIQTGLEYYFQHITHNPAIRVDAVTRISDGWETEIFAFQLYDTDGTHERILRLYPGLHETATPKSTHEYAALKQLGQAGYPVPQVYHHSTDLSWLGSPFIIMERIDGQPLGRVWWENTQLQPTLIPRFCQHFVDLHRLDATPFAQHQAGTPHPQTPDQFLPLKLQQAQTLIIDHFGQTWAQPLVDWLEQHRDEITPAPLSPMHNDYHARNLLLTPTDKMVVIDWSGLEIGDYRYDLAWTLLLESTQGQPAAMYDRLLAEYDRLTGIQTTQLAYFDVIAALRRLFTIAVSLEGDAASLGMRPEAAAILRGQAAHIQRVYAVLTRHTGLRLPHIEQMIESL